MKCMSDVTEMVKEGALRISHFTGETTKLVKNDRIIFFRTLESNKHNNMIDLNEERNC